MPLALSVPMKACAPVVCVSITALSLGCLPDDVGGLDLAVDVAVFHAGVDEGLNFAGHDIEAVRGARHHCERFGLDLRVAHEDLARLLAMTVGPHRGATQYFDDLRRNGGLLLQPVPVREPRRCRH